MLCDSMLQAPAYCADEDNLSEIFYAIRKDQHQMSIRQMLKCANMFEVLYAKQIIKAGEYAAEVYNHIPFDEYNRFEYDAVRCRMAILAYATSKFNYHEKEVVIEEIIASVTAAGYKKPYKGMLNYYRAICYCKFDRQLADEYMFKSYNSAFDLARISQDYSSAVI